MSDVADRVKKIVVEHLGVEEDKVVEAASFIDDLGADSVDTGLLYTSDAADERSSVDLGGRSSTKEKNRRKQETTKREDCNIKVKKN